MGAFKGDLNYFECGIFVGARRAGLSILETADLLGFSTISRVYREIAVKYPVFSSCVDESVLLICVI